MTVIEREFGHDDHRVAVVIPCYNEAATIGGVVSDFRAALPQAQIWVFDNNSTDDTAALACDAGARVVPVGLQGKGNVVRRMFADVEADVYVMVDGDGTYDPDSAPALVRAVLADGADMVVATRKEVDSGAYRRGHVWGNRALTGFLVRLFGRPCRDILSGYRAFSRRFAKSFPVLSSGFEIETELTVHALELRMPMVELETSYFQRPAGSHSKLSTWRDGFLILYSMLRLFAHERPLLFYGGLGALLAVVSVLLGIPVVMEYLRTGLVPRFPTAILATGLMILAALSFVTGLILGTVTRGRRELRMLAYLAQRGPGAP